MTTNNKSNVGATLLTPNAILQSRYRIVRHLGRGGMGAVYEAVDLRLGHTVALKQALTCDEKLWKQFEQEARMMAALDHPVLPRVSDYFTEDNRAFFVMQYVEGSDLSEILAQQPGPLPRNTVVAWADQLLDALIYLHSHDRQIIHRDIKPHNLRVTAGGRIVLLDFGLAKSKGANYEDNESDRSIFGYSPRYAPLEQIQDLGTTPQSDIYALGATLYHLLTGVKPPDALTRATAFITSQPNPLKPAHEINRAVGEELSEILSRAMAQNPSARYASAREFREALRRVGRVYEADSALRNGDARLRTSLEEDDEMTQLAAMQVNRTSRLGSHAIAAVFVILLAAFGVFCRYYPWKLPTTITQQAIGATAAASVSEEITNPSIDDRRWKNPEGGSAEKSVQQMPRRR
jgi:serine/threonine protein kinase